MVPEIKTSRTVNLADDNVAAAAVKTLQQQHCSSSGADGLNAIVFSLYFSLSAFHFSLSLLAKLSQDSKSPLGQASA